MNLATMAKNSGKPVVEECDAGLAKIVVPIFVRETFMGAVGACGLLMPDGEVDSFLVNKITDIDEEKVNALAHGIDSISNDSIDHLIAFIEDRLAGIIKSD